MANTLLIKRSATSGKAPAPADLQVGELAVNTADGRLFVKKSDGSVFVINPALGLTPNVVSVDFGLSPAPSKSFSLTIPNVSPGADVICSISGDQSNGSMIDELELEPLVVFGRVSAQNTLEFTISCAVPGGLTTGIKYINFYVG